MEENFQLSDHQQSVDYKEIFFKLFRYWYVFILMLIVALLIAFFFNKYSRRVYEVTTTVLVKDQSEKNVDPQDMLGFGFGLRNQNVQNEIGILASHSMVYSTVSKIGFEVSYSSEENFVTSDLYTKSPFIVELDRNYPQPLNLRFDITILSKDQYRLDVKEENVHFYDYSQKKIIDREPVTINYNQTHTFGKEIISPYFKFKIVLNSTFDPKKDINRSLYFQLKDYDDLVNEFKGYNIERINKESTILQIKITGGNVDKLADFLNALTREYIEKGLEKKNLVSIRTIDFIDNELKGISDSLFF